MVSWTDVGVSCTCILLCSNDYAWTFPFDHWRAVDNVLTRHQNVHFRNGYNWQLSTNQWLMLLLNSDHGYWSLYQVLYRYIFHQFVLNMNALVAQSYLRGARSLPACHLAWTTPSQIGWLLMRTWLVGYDSFLKGVMVSHACGDLVILYMTRSL